MLPDIDRYQETTMQTPKDETARLELLRALGQQPGVSAWFSVWQLARLGAPAREVWAPAPRFNPARRVAGNNA